MGKITVKHYVNEKLKPRIIGLDRYYPLYIQVTFNRKNYNFKSNISEKEGYLNEIGFILGELNTQIDSEIKLIERTIEYYEQGKFKILNSKSIKLLSRSLLDIWEDLIIELFFEESKKLPKYFDREYVKASHIVELNDFVFEMKGKDLISDYSKDLKVLYYGLYDGYLSQGTIYNYGIITGSVADLLYNIDRQNEINEGLGKFNENLYKVLKERIEGKF
ncbi:hypothetical protein [Flammeovirga aprica]|uniref:Uncharacterized protein n=1 Tax=Flammeovirga aprica JL-4 TaxID=694437 RepID=A0A7X9RSY6_9BACT|nr:hypothetical protein [Flammeovirga aprica]NME66604.1 hypothetical protein [Flammeovirga aprica JL-4]